jgi:predicted transcriptional regulator
MKISDIIKYTNARVVAGASCQDKELERAFSSDLMSDVLTLDDDNILLVSGLANIQLVRTAEMADVSVVLLARNKKATSEMINLAEENGLVLLETSYSIFRTSGILFSNGLKPVY